MKYRLLTASLAAVLLVGCSAPATTAPATSTPGSDATAASAAPTTGTGGSGGAPNVAPGQEVDPTALGEQLNAGAAKVNTLHMEMSTSGTVSGTQMNMTLSGDIDNTDRAKPRGALTMSGMFDMELVMDGDAYYVKMALLGPDWYKASQEDLGQTGATLPDPAEQAEQQGRMASQSTKIVYNGEETIDGVTTKHYTLSVPRDAALAGTAGSSSAPSGEDVDIPVEMYVDADGVTRRVVIEMSEPAMKVSTDMSRINEPVDITVPTDAKPFPRR